MDNSFGNRLKKLRKSLRYNSKEFAELMGITQGFLSAVENTQKGLSHKRVVLLKEKLNVNIDWLFGGKGPMFLDEVERIKGRMGDSISSSHGDDSLITKKKFNFDEFAYIPRFVELKLSAGGGNFIYNTEHQELCAFRREWIHKVASSTNNLVLMDIVGDSMYPTLKEGDTVLIDKGRNTIKDGKIFAFTEDNQLILVKRIEARGEEVCIISDNRQIYESYIKRISDIQIIGEIIWYARLLTYTPY